MFDGGQVDIYTIKNTALAGGKPKEALEFSASYFFEERKVGVTRFYAALKSDVRIERLIRVWQDRDVLPGQICIIEELQYRIVQAQHGENEDGLKITDLSLERTREAYDIV